MQTRTSSNEKTRQTRIHHYSQNLSHRNGNHRSNRISDIFRERNFVLKNDAKFKYQATQKTDMERGEALVVLSVVALVGVIASTTLLLTNPAGSVVQGETIIPQPRPSPILCEAGNQAFLLSTGPRFAVFCCPEDMIGQNECKEAHTLYS